MTTPPMPRSRFDPSLGRPVALLLGVRVSMDAYINKTRSGAGASVVVDQIPLSGPIVLFADPDSDRPFSAVCIGCRCRSKDYMRRGEPQIKAWVHSHRCPPVSKPELKEAQGIDAKWYQRG